MKFTYTSCYFKDACWRLNNEYALVTAQAEREVFSNKTSSFNWAAFTLRNDTAKGEGIRGPCKMFSFAFHVLLLEIISHHAFAVDVSFTNSFFASLDEDQNVKLYWNVSRKTKEIFFTVEANTLGWIGFGISRGQGKMQGADIVIGWVKDGKPYFQDRHADGYMVPDVDSQQDYELISLSEDNGKTIMKFKRKFDTCDTDDIKIESGTTKVIYAYHPDDPSSESSIPRHSPANRGPRSVLLLNSAKKDSILPPDAKYFDIRHNKTAVPGDETSYMCVAFEIPKLNEAHHIVQIDPVIQAGHEGVVHHMLLYQCRDDVPEHHLNYTGRCYSSNMPPPLRQCSGSSTIFAWAVGGKEFYFPKHVGFPIGTPDSPKVVILEVHYDNPQEREGMIDSSGLRLYYTKRLRKYDAGMLYVGAAVDRSMMIPPKEKSWEFNGFCSEECTKEGLRNSKLPEGGISVIASGLHTHLAGRKVILRHIRNGLELPEIARDEHYDFNFQEYHLLDKEIHIAPGDSLITKCIYDTQDRNWVTNGGISTREEMCLSFLVYYPKVNFSRCVSWEKPAWQKWNDEYVKQNYSLLRKPSFWTKEVNQGLREAYRDTNEIYARCLARADIALPGLGYKETQKPLIKTPYKPKPSCDIVSMATRGVVPGSLGVLIAVFSLITFVH
ncbi:DBH-like monooxygenase protein 1 [Montipora foliosa]|uniref:DBH-like monooxygenase protein 1 n=1 Tax=Montipora foliosa TaxID=591990 RepID=UPI0035F1E5D6